MEDNELIRCFAAVPVDAAILETIGGIQHRLDRRCQSSGVKWVNPRHIHLTLRFFGNVPTAHIADLKIAMEQACRGILQFELKAENTGCFPSWDKPRVIWVGLAGNLAPLLALKANVDAQTASFGDKDESQAFMPHLTLARIKTNSPHEMREIGEKVRTLTVGAIGKWTAAQMHLFKSRLTPQGPEYEILATIPLQAKH